MVQFSTHKFHKYPQSPAAFGLIYRSTMCFSPSKCDADNGLTPPRDSKQIRLSLRSAEGSSNDKQCNCRPSSTHECTMKEQDHLRDIEELEQLCMRHRQEVEELQMTHAEELQMCHDCIDALKDEMQYQQAIIDVLNGDVEWLESETDRQKKDIDGFISQGIEDGMECRRKLALMRDTIVEMFDNSNL
ncbi:hypothetical protein BDR03DRAFT_1011867 [Suillus americanus]|nr:hypothetical protein BDR03DRAFT_1011867 [Suillus americanus]